MSQTPDFIPGRSIKCAEYLSIFKHLTAVDELLKAFCSDEMIMDALYFTLTLGPSGVADGHFHFWVITDKAAIQRGLARS